jgi:hypothetical protein
MKLLPAVFILPLAILPFMASGQATCTRTVDTDNYSNPSAWTATGAGNVTVSNGACTWNGAQCGIYDRVYRPLASTLSDNYFKAEFKFTVQQNPGGQGGGSNLIGFSAGTLDPISYDNSQSYATTNQDGLVLLVGSASTSDNNISNWTISLSSKDGSTNTYGTNSVQLSASVSTYYIVFERQSLTQTQLSVYTDAAHTQLFGQAANAISASITGLTHVHHGVTTWGWTARHLTGTVDDLEICDDLGVASCTTMDSDNYSSNAAWNATGAGNVTVTNGACTWNGAQCGSYDRVYRPLAATLSDTYFKAEFKFTVQQNPGGQGGGADLVSFSAGTLDPLSYDNSQSYATTNQDGLILLVGSASTSDNNISNWTLSLAAKDGTTNTYGTNSVQLSASVSTYYVVFERQSLTQTLLSVYTDAAHTVLQGQAANTISATITGLTHLHHGVTTWGWTTRHFSGTVDDIVICDDLTGIFPEPGADAGFTVYPNPSEGHITIELSGALTEGTLNVYNALGQAVLNTRFNRSTRRLEMDLAPGMYFIVADDGEAKRSAFRVLVK